MRKNVTTIQLPKVVYHVPFFKRHCFVVLQVDQLSQKLKSKCDHHLSKDDQDISVKISEAKARCDLGMQAGGYFNDRLTIDAHLLRLCHSILKEGIPEEIIPGISYLH